MTIHGPRAKRACFVLAFLFALFCAFPSVPVAESSACVSDDAGGLSAFAKGLRGQETQQRGAVRILYLGDSHIAGDGIARQLRQAFAARLGGARPDMFTPGLPHPFYEIEGLKISMRGRWQSVSARPLQAEGVFGLSGFRLESDDRESEISITVEGARKPASLDIWMAGDGDLDVYAFEKKQTVAQVQKDSLFRILRVEFPLEESEKNYVVRLKPKGGATVRLMSAALNFEDGAVHLSAFGVPGAKIDITRRMNDDVVKSELSHLKPDLIIIGYGTNEGFDDGLSEDAYIELLKERLAWLQRLAPQASLLLLGVADGARPASSGSSDSLRQCGVLTPNQRRAYQNLIGAGNLAPVYWHAPSGLDAVRSAQRDTARRLGLSFIDLSKAMGGVCSIHRWARQTPPKAFADHVHFKPAGQEILAQAIFTHLISALNDLSCKTGAKAGNLN